MPGCGGLGVNVGDEDGSNPFKLPPDDQWFFFQEQEVQRRDEELERVRHLKVCDKSTASSRIGRNRRADGYPPQPPKALPAPGGGPRAEVGAATLAAASAARRSLFKGSSAPSGDGWRERGGVQSYVAKKHELFLAQMNIDVKRAEVLKLDEKATRKEEAMKKSQQMLEEDIAKFDAFLQSNDQKAHKALRTAEEMAKKKQEKLQKIRQLKSQLGALHSEIAKYREQKEECVKLKSFLEKLTPQEWKDAKVSEKRGRKLSRKWAWVDAQIAVINAQVQAEVEAEERVAEERAADASKSRPRRQRREAEEEQTERERDLEARRRRIRRRFPTREAKEAEYQEVSSGEEVPLYFQEPKQLLDVFTAMEESNLFLIQNVQDTEHALEELQQKSRETKQSAAVKREKMNQMISGLEKQIEDERTKCEELRAKIAAQEGASSQEDLLRYLTDKALEVHAACGYEQERDPDTLQMLAAVEAKLEDFLSAFSEAEAVGMEKLVEGLERAAESQRRELVKRQRKAQLDRKIEERLKASLLRSQAPVHKKSGKQIMFRSPPTYTAQRVVQEDDGYESAVREHNLFGIWTGKDGMPNASQPTRP